MAKYLHIQIPKPCTEEWNSMHSSTGGRFCDSCQKTVIDFTRMSDEQLLNFFTKKKEHVCGRFSAEQLETEIPLPVKRIPLLTYFFKVVIPAFLFLEKANAQQSFSHLQRISWMPEKRPLQETKTMAERIVTGVVKSEDNKSIPFATIAVVGTARGVSADSAGGFFIKLAPGQKLIEVSAIGYGRKQFQVNDEDNGINTTLKMDLVCHKVYLGGTVGMVVVKSTRIKKKKKPVPVAVISNAVNSIVIFPNPVKPFSPLTIRWKIPVTANQEISLFNASGNVVLRQTIPVNKPITEFSFNVQGNTAGYYVLHVTDSKRGKSFTSAIVVE